MSLLGRAAGTIGITNRVRAMMRLEIERQIRSMSGDIRRDLRQETASLRSEVTRLHGELASKVDQLEGELATAIQRQLRAERKAAQFMLKARLDDKHRGDVERLPTMLARERVAAHVAEAIGRAVLHADPFPHIVVEEVVPADLYRIMLRAIPPTEFFGDKDPIKQNLRIPTDECPELTTQVWQFVDEVVARSVIVPAVLEKFRLPLQRHYATIFGEEFQDRAAALPQATSGGRVMLRRPGYRLAPHRDPKRSMLTCLMYLARRTDDERYGTEIYRVSGDHEASFTQTYYPEQHGAVCELVAVVPYRPNSMLVFLNGQGAHGARIPDDAPADLERFAYQFYVGPDGDALAGLLADLPAERRAKWQDRRTLAGS